MNTVTGTRKIETHKPKLYKFGIVLPIGKYEASHSIDDVWRVKWQGVFLSIREKDFNFID